MQLARLPIKKVPAHQANHPEFSRELDLAMTKATQGHPFFKGPNLALLAELRRAH